MQMRMVPIIKMNRLLTSTPVNGGVDSNHIISHLEMRENRPEQRTPGPKAGSRLPVLTHPFFWGERNSVFTSHISNWSIWENKKQQKQPETRTRQKKYQRHFEAIVTWQTSEKLLEKKTGFLDWASEPGRCQKASCLPQKRTWTLMGIKDHYTWTSTNG